jgi:hypothetical protein
MRLLTRQVFGALLLSGCVGYVGETDFDAGRGPDPSGEGGTSGGSTGNGAGGSPGGSGGRTGMGGALGAGGMIGTEPTTGLPCDVQALVQTRCTLCHAATPVNGAPMPLLNRANLMAMSTPYPGQTFAQRALARVQLPVGQMPPAPATRVTATEIQGLSNWIAAGYPATTCSTGGTGGKVGGAGGAGGGGISGAGGRAGTGGAGGAVVGAGLPCDVQAVYQSHCTLCHAATPVNGAPMPLVTRANLTAASFTSTAQTFAQRTVVRMQSTTMPMPPAPGTRATAAEVTTVNNWIAAGYPAGTCGAGGAGGGGGTVTPDPLGATARCTSGTTWTGGNNGSSVMNPGRACVACHVNADAPRWTIAGTVYPTGHEPNLCNGANGNNGARVVIVDAANRTITLTPNSAGNFMTTTAITAPYRAKITYQGRERIMPVAQTSGDCNNCHTQNGANGAPGRITLP